MRARVQLLAQAAEFPLEDLVRAKLAAFLARLGKEQVPGLYDSVMGQVERPLLELALSRAEGRLGDAALALGIHRNTLRRRIKALGIKKR